MMSPTSMQVLLASMMQVSGCAACRPYIDLCYIDAARGIGLICKSSITICFSPPLCETRFSCLYSSRRDERCGEELEAAIHAAREHNTLVHIHRKLSNENLCDIFIALVYPDTPSLANPQGWYLRVNGVCHLWRELAVHCAELWARSIGSFPSQLMTDLAIQRAGASLLSLDGHFEDHEGPGYVLTGYQLSLVEGYASRLRSLGHDDYWPWSELFYCMGAFPELETARIWDESGPDEWDECIDTPRLQSLYMNNALIPFNAPALRYLRVDMDNVNWRADREFYRSYVPVTEGCEAIPRVFPTLDFIAFLQRSPSLEQLIVTNMPSLLSEDLRTMPELHAELPKLRRLHLGGKSKVTYDFWLRLKVPPDAQIFIDTGPPGLPYNYLDIVEGVQEQMDLPVYDSLRLSMTPSYDFLLQMWSAEAEGPGVHGVHGLDLPMSLGRDEGMVGPAFTFRYPIGLSKFIEKFIDAPVPTLPPDDCIEIEDPFLSFQNEMAKRFYTLPTLLLKSFESQTVKHVDLTDWPFNKHSRDYIPTGRYDNPIEIIAYLFVWKSVSKAPMPHKSVILSWTFIKRVLETGGEASMDRLGNFYLASSVDELTIVNFPCASFPSSKRFDEHYNAEAWDLFLKFCVRCSSLRHQDRLFALKLAESASDMSNMERSEEPEYEHTIPGSYEDAVKAVTEKGYQRIAPFVTSFEDLRIHTWT